MYGSLGLKILAFPCNQFGKQEPKPEAEIKKWVYETFGFQDTMMSKIEVNGSGIHPVFNWCKRNSDMWNPETQKAKVIPWNFDKFLIDRDGKLVLHYSQRPLPLDFVAEIEELLDTLKS